MYKVQQINNTPISLELKSGPQKDECGYGYVISPISVEMDMSQSWVDRTPTPDAKRDPNGLVIGVVGAEFDGIIYNNTEHDISNWTMIIHLPMKGKLDSFWNGDYEIINGGADIILYPNEYISLLPAHEGKPFGFVLKTDEEIQITDFSFEGYETRDIHDFPMYWILWIAIIAWFVSLVVYVIMLLQIQNLEERRIHDEEIISQTMMTFAGFIDAKDEYTKGHSVRVSQYSKAIAKHMKMKEEDIRQLGYIALLHDSGKIGVPDLVLKKPDFLTDSERKVIESHTVLGGKILENFNAIEGIKYGALYHHERYDGKGYPNGLCGEEIPLCARIICVADSFDAMNSDRCYRKHLPKDIIIDELEKNKGLQFDPIIVQHLIELIKDGTIKVLDEFH